MHGVIRGWFSYLSELGQDGYLVLHHWWWDVPEGVRLQRVYGTAGTLLGAGAVLLLARLIS
jgi:hypothetical protein